MALDINTSMSDKAILLALGGRLKSRRIQREVTQHEAQTGTGLSLNTIKNLEQGKGTLTTFIIYMRFLDALGELNTCLLPPTLSPMAALRLGITPRQRVRKARHG